MTGETARAMALAQEMFRLHVKQLGYLVDGCGTARAIVVVEKLIDEAAGRAEKIPATDEARRTLVQLKIRVLEKKTPSGETLDRHVGQLDALVTACATPAELASVERMVDEAREYVRGKAPGNRDAADALDRLKVKVAEMNATVAEAKAMMGGELLKGTVKPPAAKTERGPRKGRVR